MRKLVLPHKSFRTAMWNCLSLPGQQSFFCFSSRRRHTRYMGDWSSDVCSSDLEIDSEVRAHVAPHAARQDLGVDLVEAGQLRGDEAKLHGAGLDADRALAEVAGGDLDVEDRKSVV